MFLTKQFQSHDRKDRKKREERPLTGGEESGEIGATVELLPAVSPPLSRRRLVVLPQHLVPSTW